MYVEYKPIKLSQHIISKLQNMQTSKVYITFTIEYLPIPFQVDDFHADIISYGLRHGHRSFSPDFIPAQVEFHQVCALRCNPQKNSQRL